MLKNKIKENLNGKSLRSLGEDIGVCWSSMHNISNKEDLSTISLGNIVSIAKVLNVDIKDLFDIIAFKVSSVVLRYDSNGDEYTENQTDTMFSSYNYSDCVKFINEDFDINDYSYLAKKGEKINVLYEISSYLDSEDGMTLTEDCHKQYCFPVNSIFKENEKLEGISVAITSLEEMQKNLKTEPFSESDIEFYMDEFLNETSELGFDYNDIKEYTNIKNLIQRLESIHTELINKSKVFKQNLDKLTTVE